MINVSQQELLDAGVHFGHLKRKWNPKMAPYIFMERNGIHILDLNKTHAKLAEAASAMRQIAKSGKKILFVATKKQAKDIVANAAKSVNMPFINERWPGGMLTNFATQRKSVKKMMSFDKFMSDGTYAVLSKKEKLNVSRQKAKMEKVLGSIADLTRLPAAIFVVDIVREHIAVAEANKLNIPIIGICDTNSDPSQVDFAIPGNDDATKSISLILKIMVKSIEEGLAERAEDKDADKENDEDQIASAAGANISEEEEDDKGAKKKTNLRPRKTTARKPAKQKD
ncbi:MAG TPA: 30S ribosomal protein S2 [Bacteroidia bacterium]|nr:30S ribosomal protein S2 [Bacteroidia bacterium]HNT80509.1 30S ribosomal protein S2 [Bacteroidia bacterium]